MFGNVDTETLLGGFDELEDSVAGPYSATKGSGRPAPGTGRA
jgi:hypothetical protein